MDIVDILRLHDHGPDTWVGTGPRYPWGGLYGGQIVAQALRAACLSVADGFVPHSVRAYFIRPGDHAAPVRYEVDRPRDGRSFCTRRVIARQAVGAILNCEASFQRHEASPDIQTVAFDDVPSPDDVPPDSSWLPTFERRFVPGTDAMGRVRSWFRVTADLGDDPILQACALAYISDDLPTDAVVRVHPAGRLPTDEGDRSVFTASLDHTIWFHRPVQVDRWHLHDLSCHGFANGRGLSIGHVFTEAGVHVATIAQEVLLRFRQDGEQG